MPTPETPTPAIPSRDDPTGYGLWIGATLVYGVGDLLTTLTILTVDLGIDESNLLIRHVFTNLGVWGIVAMKLAVFVVAVTISLVVAARWQDRVLYYAPPIILIVLGGLATANNLYLLLLH